MLLFANEIYLSSFYNKGFAIASQVGMYPVGTMKARRGPIRKGYVFRAYV